MKTIQELEAEIAREIPVHATECVASPEGIEERRQSERHDAVRVVIYKRKRAEALADLYRRLSKANVSEPQNVAPPRCFSEVCVLAVDSLRDRSR